MRGVAHQPVERGPDGAEYLGRRPEGGLLEREVGFLGLLGWTGRWLVGWWLSFFFFSFSFFLVGGRGRGGDVRRVLYPTAVPRAMGRSMEGVGLAKMS